MKEKHECPLCGKWDYLETHHIFEGVGRRAISDRLWLVLEVCPACHRSIHSKPKAWEWLKERTQRGYMEMENMTEDEWIDIFGRSWLKGDG